MSKMHYIIPIFVPHQGCPFHCVFCNQKKISGAKAPIDIEQTAFNIEKYLKTIQDPRDKHIEIAFYGGSFIGLLHISKGTFNTCISVENRKGPRYSDFYEAGLYR